MFTVHDSGTTEQEARQTPWDHVDVVTVVPDGWSTSKVEDGLRVLERIRRQVESASAALVAAMPESRDAVTALVRVTGVSAAEARRRRVIAAVVQTSSVVASLLGAGLLSAEHVAALGPIREHVDDLDVVALAAVGKLPEDVRADVEQVRLSHCAGSDVSARQRALRRLVVSAGPEGMIAIRGLLPPLEGAMFDSLLRAVMDANWRLEHPERAPVLGGHGGDSREQRRLDALLQLLGIPSGAGTGSSPPVEPPVAEVASQPTSPSDRSPTQDEPTIDGENARTDGESNHGTDPGDAVTEPCDERASSDANGRTNAGPPSSGPADAAVSTRAAVAPVRAVSVRPSVVIVFDIDRYEAEILGHGPIAVTPDLFDSTKADLYYFFRNGRGEVLKFGRAKRDPTAAQRLAVEVRDRHCIYPHCRAPASRCQVHHLNEWLLDQGFTDVEVLGLFCDPHHRHVHVDALIADRQSDGTVTIRIRSSGETIATATRIHSPPDR